MYPETIEAVSSATPYCEVVSLKLSKDSIIDNS